MERGLGFPLLHKYLQMLKVLNHWNILWCVVTRKKAAMNLILDDLTLLIVSLKTSWKKYFMSCWWIKTCFFSNIYFFMFVHLLRNIGNVLLIYGVSFETYCSVFDVLLIYFAFCWYFLFVFILHRPRYYFL